MTAPSSPGPRDSGPGAPQAPEDLATDQLMAANLSALLIKECGLHSPGSSAHDLLQRAAAMLVNYGLPAIPPAPEPKCFPNAIHRCSNCQSEGLEWGSYVQLVAAGMGPDKAKPIFALGCVDCSETLRVVDAEDVATWMNKQMSTATPPAPEPGEVDELIHCLRIREQSLGSEDTKLAALVQQLAEPAKALVVPVNEQPWNRPGWCDAEGRCWLCNSYSMGRWNYDTPPDPAQDWGRLGTVTHSAPHWAIPRPGRMPELPSLSVYSYDAGESVRISRMGESNRWCIIVSGLIPDWWFNQEMHGAALAAIRLAQQTAKKSEET
jgi:hypothetical protein